MDKTSTAGHNNDIETPGCHRSDIQELQRRSQAENSDSWLVRYLSFFLKNRDDDENVAMQKDARAVVIDASVGYEQSSCCRRFWCSKFGQLTVGLTLVMAAWLALTIVLVERIVKELKFGPTGAGHVITLMAFGMFWIVFFGIACIIRIIWKREQLEDKNSKNGQGEFALP